MGTDIPQVGRAAGVEIARGAALGGEGLDRGKRRCRQSRATAVRRGAVSAPSGAVPTSYVMMGMISSATMFATLIMGLMAGPAVSL